MLKAEEVKFIRQTVLELAGKEQALGMAHNYSNHAQRVWNLLGKNVLFHELISAPFIVALMEHIFDRPTPHQKFFLSSFQANIIKPGAEALHLHIDTPVPEPLPPWIIKANSIWLLDDFTIHNGATEVIPGSHTRPRKPRRDEPSDCDGLIKLVVPAGSVVITHGALWHRSGANRSAKDRVVLLGSFAASYAREIASEEDIVRCLTTETINTMNESVKKLVGFYHGIKPGGTSFSESNVIPEYTGTRVA
jgi:ectoine hydroxylase-related dioxygenase (phytanoyl-CoA dioxygenase family)